MYPHIFLPPNLTSQQFCLFPSNINWQYCQTLQLGVIWVLYILAMGSQSAGSVPIIPVWFVSAPPPSNILSTAYVPTLFMYGANNQINNIFAEASNVFPDFPFSAIPRRFETFSIFRSMFTEVTFKVSLFLFLLNTTYGPIGLYLY